MEPLSTRELFGDAAFVEGARMACTRVSVFSSDKEFAVTEDAAGIVDEEGDELGLFA